MIAADCHVKTGKMSVSVNPGPETRCAVCGLATGRADPASRDGRIVELGLHCRVDHASPPTLAAAAAITFPSRPRKNAFPF